MKGRNLTGKRFNRFIVLRLSHTGKYYAKHWIVQCDCGTIKTIRNANLVSGTTKSCGCLDKERRTTHGLSKTPTYNIWTTMLHRCNSPKNENYARYGGRGIKVCDRWLNYENFLEDMGERPEGMSIERIRNNEGYSKLNCKWATHKEQCRNRRTNLLFEYQGETKTLIEWSEKFNINYKLLYDRVRHGWTIAKAIETKKRRW